MSIVWERVNGPTGHPLIVNELSECQKPSQDQSELVMRLKSGGQCWRDVQLVKNLTRVRMEVVKRQWNESKAKHSLSARVLSTTTTREEMREIWSQVMEIRRETWRNEDSIHQRKTSHLVKKSRDCAKHKMCSLINQQVVDRAKSWVQGTISQPRECESGATSTTPGSAPSTSAGKRTCPRFCRRRRLSWPCQRSSTRR